MKDTIVRVCDNCGSFLVDETGFCDGCGKSGTFTHRVDVPQVTVEDERLAELYTKGRLELTSGSVPGGL